MIRPRLSPPTSRLATRAGRGTLVALIVALAVATAACTDAGAASAGVGMPGTSSKAGCPTSQPAPLPSGQTRTVTITTAKGTIAVKVQGSLSPIAAGNFVALASCGFYDGVVFHRTAALQDGTPFVIQGGDPTGTGSGGPGYTIRDEPVTAPYHRGTLAMARTSQPNSQGSQFFIVLSDAAGPVLSGYNTYAIFGDVTSGMDVADAIFAASKGAEIPPNPIAMQKVSVSNP
jgi:cyclophilin family peptidyl-prolyl cis-trans isomerase